MRPETNRMLVGGVSTDSDVETRPTNPYARRHLAEMILGLLIVFACIYIFVPVFMGTAESARRTLCVSHLRRLAQAMEMYQSDHDGAYPPSEGWMRSVFSYVVRPAGALNAEDDDLPRRRGAAGQPGESEGAEIFYCPSEENLPRRRRAAPGTTLSSYTYLQPAVTTASDRPFAWDLNGGSGAAAHPRGGNVAYLDGRVMWRASSQWSGSDQP
jgi:prepilin-type processing-associated H-X9-DG protein